MPVITRRFNEAQVAYILTSDLSNAMLAAELDCSRQLIQMIRTGKHYADFCPHLERRNLERNLLRCTDCVHFHHREGERMRCDLDLPEIRKSGVRAAEGCAYHCRKS